MAVLLSSGKMSRLPHRYRACGHGDRQRETGSPNHQCFCHQAPDLKDSEDRVFSHRLADLRLLRSGAVIPVMRLPDVDGLEPSFTVVPTVSAGAWLLVRSAPSAGAVVRYREGCAAGCWRGGS